MNSRSYCVPPLEAWIFVGLFYVFLVADFVKNSLNAYEMSCVYLIKHLYIYIYLFVYVHILFLYRDNSYVLMCYGLLSHISFV